MSDILYFVVPCYNEEEVLEETANRLFVKLTALIKSDAVSEKSRILFVNDGSKDKTWEIIQSLHNGNGIFSGIDLARNRGQQNAILAGLLTAKDYADIVISMDADLQDDIETVDKFIEQYKNGYDIVYGVRSSRQTDTFFKRNTALAFYRLMSAFGLQIVYNHAEYRLMSKRALNGLAEFKEIPLFLRGIIPLIGYKQTTVEYERHERFAGKTKYNIKAMVSLALNALTSLSVKPIRFILSLGLFISFISFMVFIISLILMAFDTNLPLLAYVIMSVWFIGGLQLAAIGIVGEYVGKTYAEVKERPRFIIAERLIDE